MKRGNYSVYILLALVLGILIYTAVGLFGGGKTVEKTAVIEQPASGFKSITTGNTDTGSVEIQLTPLGVKDGKFQVSIDVNTHSVDLSPFDLKEITVLEYEGNSVKPVSGPSLSGHHSSGIIEFDAGSISKFTIKIKGIPSVEERVFEWEQS